MMAQMTNSFILQVSWRPVFWGLGMQFCIGLFVIRTHPGFVTFNWLGEQVQVFNFLNSKVTLSYINKRRLD